MGYDYIPPYTSPLAQEDPVIRSQKYYDKIFGEQVKHYEKTFENKQDYQRYLDKNDDEYWNDYIKTIRGDRVGNIEEVLVDGTTEYVVNEIDSADDYLITISSTEDGRVNINMSRRDALLLMENLGSDEGKHFLSTAGSVRSLLKDFFVYNKSVSSEDKYY